MEYSDKSVNEGLSTAGKPLGVFIGHSLDSIIEV